MIFGGVKHRFGGSSKPTKRWPEDKINDFWRRQNNSTESAKLRFGGSRL